MPFRLDLVMGGVSDLDFWSSMKGDCLSLTCNVSGKAVQMEGELSEENCIWLEGFEEGRTLCYSIRDMNCLDVSQVEPCARMGVAALRVALAAVQDAGIPISHGFYIKNCSLRQKGMGGSSVAAAAIIALLCQLYNVPVPPIHEMISRVAEAERLCGSNGGWEDVAGSYYAGINRVKYRPSQKDVLCVESPCIDSACFEALQKSLLLVDSGISASTGAILTAAHHNFLENRSGVIAASVTIQNECDKVLQALRLNDMQYLGRSLTLQRGQWGKITGGMSSCPQVDEMMAPLAEDIYGYREAGAGGGGTVLIACKEKKKNAVSEWLQHKGIQLLPWCVSEYGLKTY